MGTVETVVHVFLFLLALCIFMSNLIVLAAIVKCKDLHIPSNIFVAGMALADASVAVIGIPLRFVATLDLKIDFYSCVYINCIHLYTLDLSFYMLLVFTFDRLYAIRFPSRYHQKVKCADAINVVYIVWFVGFLVALIPSVTVSENQQKEYTEICSFDAVMPQEYLVYVSASVIFFGTLSILVVVNTYILCVVARHKRRSMTDDDVRTNRVRKVDLKSEKMLVGMIAAFLVCCLPLNIFVLAWHYGGYQDDDVHQVLLAVYYLNSLLNPFIYAVSNKRIRRACVNLILRRPLSRFTSKASSLSVSRCESVETSDLSKVPRSADDSESKETLDAMSQSSSFIKWLSEPQSQNLEEKNSSTTTISYQTAK